MFDLYEFVVERTEEVDFFGAGCAVKSPFEGVVMEDWMEELL